MRWTRNLLVRLLTPYLLALAAMAASVYAYSDRVVEHLYLATLGDMLGREARLMGGLLPWDLHGPDLDRRCATLAVNLGARLSVIAPDGTVLGDSEAPSAGLENHRDRPEVHAAFLTGDGESTRFSTSVNRPLFYRAWRQPAAQSSGNEWRVIRLALPVAPIDASQHRIRAAIWGGVVLAALAALLPTLVITHRLSKRVRRLASFATAVAAGDDPLPLRPEGDDLIGDLERDLGAMAVGLRTQLQTAYEEKRKLEAVLSGMVEGVLVVDQGGSICLSNQRAARILGVADADSLLGRPLIAVSRDPDLQSLVRDVTCAKTREPLVREITLAHGTQQTLRVTATAISEPGQPPTLFILVFHDITELKKLETTRRDFVANVSHELRTPITAIRGYAETLLAGAVNNPEQADKFLRVIERHSERLSRLTDDLLTLSDLELGRMEIQRAPMRLGVALDAAVDVVRDKAARGQVAIHERLPTDLPLLDADADRIEQVLVNLIDNAVKYTPVGGQVTISAHPVGTGAPPPAVEICVADTGAGIPTRDLPRLTERFYRVDKARARELGGTGLGLAIVKHIVQAHHGTLRIESELGRGTRVFVVLPAAAPEA